MAPRTLEPVAVSQLTVWGLRGFTALDPDVVAELRDGKLRLTARDRVLLASIAARRTRRSSTGPTRPRSCPLPRWPLRLWFAAPAHKASCRASSTNCSTTSIPIPATCAPREAGEDRERRSGQAGAGLRLVRRGAAIAVAEAISDGPGAVAGIRPGDTILAVDGQSTQGRDARTVAELIDGPEGTRVVISWRSHDGRMRTARTGTRHGAAGDGLRAADQRHAAGCR